MANATERELQKQIGIIKRYAEIGKAATFDTDYEFLEPMTRTLDDVQVATGKIEQGDKKRHYALFWMVKNTQFDEIAFNNLNENNTDKAIDIWEKTLKSVVTKKNYSSYLNLSTLYAAISVTNTMIDLPMLQKSFKIKSQVLNSESLKFLSELISTNPNSVDATEISKRFVDETYEWLKPYIDKPVKTLRDNEQQISFFEEDKAIGKPYFALFAPTAPHWPLHDPPDMGGSPDMGDRYAGAYTDGFELLRERRIKAAAAAGVLPKGADLDGYGSKAPDWQSLSEEFNAVNSRVMEIYAAMTTHLDSEVGRLLNKLRDIGALDNTLIMFINDNGAEGGPIFRPPLSKRAAKRVDNSLENLGAGNSWAHMGQGWADAVEEGRWPDRLSLQR